MDDAKDLIAKRDQVDKEIEEHFTVLKNNGVDMKTALVDSEGFPRNDIDIYAIRDARVKIIRLQNDRSALSKEIEEKLAEIHTSKSAGNGNLEDEKAVHRTTNRPFLKISRVEPDSPADEGGLKADDLIVQFGTLHGDNYKDLQQLSDVMKAAVGKTLKATVLRETCVKRLEFNPREWKGKGIFGAGFITLDTSNIL
uniref:Nas2 N-terminal domain-containing protein n=1 Tax=Panagrolaimus sp. JU765 TaxID=591449 RepID=A0AC34QNQ0_9BILA